MSFCLGHTVQVHSFNSAGGGIVGGMLANTGRRWHILSFLSFAAHCESTCQISPTGQRSGWGLSGGQGVGMEGGTCHRTKGPRGGPLAWDSGLLSKMGAGCAGLVDVVAAGKMRRGVWGGAQEGEGLAGLVWVLGLRAP